MLAPQAAVSQSAVHLSLLPSLLHPPPDLPCLTHSIAAYPLCLQVLEIDAFVQRIMPPLLEQNYQRNTGARRSGSAAPAAGASGRAGGGSWGVLVALVAAVVWGTALIGVGCSVRLECLSADARAAAQSAAGLMLTQPALLNVCRVRQRARKQPQRPHRAARARRRRRQQGRFSWQRGRCACCAGAAGRQRPVCSECRGADHWGGRRAGLRRHGRCSRAAHAGQQRGHAAGGGRRTAAGACG